MVWKHFSRKTIQKSLLNLVFVDSPVIMEKRPNVFKTILYSETKKLLLLLLLYYNKYRGELFKLHLRIFRI